VLNDAGKTLFWLQVENPLVDTQAIGCAGFPRDLLSCKINGFFVDVKMRIGGYSEYAFSNSIPSAT
jgi:hypothetical protein